MIQGRIMLIFTVAEACPEFFHQGQINLFPGFRRGGWRSRNIRAEYARKEVQWQNISYLKRLILPPMRSFKIMGRYDTIYDTYHFKFHQGHIHLLLHGWIRLCTMGIWIRQIYKKEPLPLITQIYFFNKIFPFGFG